MTVDMELVRRLEEKAVQIRKDMCVTTSKIGYSHMGGGMSMADFAVALYYDFLNFDSKNPNDPNRDRFVLSKGHCGHVLYNIFVDKGMYTKEELWSEYNKIGGRFGMHPNHHYIEGIEASTGSLGHGLPLSLGMALAARMDKKDYRIICMTGDGEMNEGTNWEAIMAAAQYGMGNLALVVDKNQFQIGGNTTEIMNLEPLDKKLEAFNWDTVSIDGHDMVQIVEALHSPPPADSQTRKKPIAIISNTLKGKCMLPGLEGSELSHISVMVGDMLEQTCAVIDANRKERG